MTLAFTKSCYGLHKGFFVLYLSLNHIRRTFKTKPRSFCDWGLSLHFFFETDSTKGRICSLVLRISRSQAASEVLSCWKTSWTTLQAATIYATKPPNFACSRESPIKQRAKFRFEGPAFMVMAKMQNKKAFMKTITSFSKGQSKYVDWLIEIIFKGYICLVIFL